MSSRHTSGCARQPAWPESLGRPAPLSNEGVSDPVIQRSSGPAAHGPRIETGTFGPWQTNAYLVWDGRSPDALVLDPGMGAATELVERVMANGLRLHLIANSHGHIDHVFDNAALNRAPDAPIGIHPEDVYRLAGHNTYGCGVEASTAERHLNERDQRPVRDLTSDGR